MLKNFFMSLKTLKYGKNNLLMIICSIIFLLIWLCNSIIDNNNDTIAALYLLLAVVWLIMPCINYIPVRLFRCSTHSKFFQTQLIPVSYSICGMIAVLADALVCALKYEMVSGGHILSIALFLFVFEIFSAVCYKFYISSTIILGGIGFTCALCGFFDNSPLLHGGISIGFVPELIISLLLVIVTGFISYGVMLLLYRTKYSKYAIAYMDKSGLI